MKKYYERHQPGTQLAIDQAAIKRHVFTGTTEPARKPGRPRNERPSVMYEGRYHIASQGRKCGVVHFSV